MRQERHVNDTESILDGGISDSATSLTLTDGSGFPSEGDFRLIIESELLLATARSSNVLTVERGIEDSTPAAHVDGKPVRVIVTEGSLKQFWSDFAPLYMPDSTPPKRIYDSSGDPIGQSDFTWFNQSTASSADQVDGSILLTTPSNSTSLWRGKYVAPPSAPWIVIAAFSTLWLHTSSADFPQCGITVENSGDGKLTIISFHGRGGNSPGIQISKMTDYSTFSSSYVDLKPLGATSDLIWLKFEDDNSNHKQYVSIDGVNWLLLNSASRTDWLSNGGNRVGFGHDAAGNDYLSLDHLTYLKHWSWS